MSRRFSNVGLLALALGLAFTATASAAKPPLPDEAKGFVGTLEGTIKEKAPANAWIGLTVTKATPEGKSKVKDGAVLVDKEIPVSCRLAGNDPQPEQKAYFETLKVGDQVTLKVFYNDNAGNLAMRLKEVPAGAPAKPAN